MAWTVGNVCVEVYQYHYLCPSSLSLNSSSQRTCYSYHIYADELQNYISRFVNLHLHPSYRLITPATRTTFIWTFHATVCSKELIIFS